MAFNMIGAVVLLLLVFGFFVYVVGYISFSKTFLEEYSTTTFHMADTATTLINGDHLDSYLSGEELDEYLQTRDYLDAYCQRINVSLIYVIKVDTDGYDEYTSVFNLVNNSVDNTNYIPWELELGKPPSFSEL